MKKEIDINKYKVSKDKRQIICLNKSKFKQVVYIKR